jgi:antitoxin (DNA-binding transcriptional repressor) of toxin-antitoxin stability system
MKTVTIRQAKTKLSRLIALAQAGEDVVIMRRNIAVARLSAISTQKHKRTFGMLKGKIPTLPDEFFFDALPDDELRLWEGGD